MREELLLRPLSVLSMSEQDSYKTVRAYDLLHQSVIQSSYTKTILVDIFGCIFGSILLFSWFLFPASIPRDEKVHWLSHWNLGQNEHKRSLFLFKRDCFLLLETKSLPLMLETEDTFSRWMFHVSLRGWIEGSKRRSRGGKQGINEEKPFSDFLAVSWHEVQTKPLTKPLSESPSNNLPDVALFSALDTSFSPFFAPLLPWNISLFLISHTFLFKASPDDHPPASSTELPSEATSTRDIHHHLFPPAFYFLCQGWRR